MNSLIQRRILPHAERVALPQKWFRLLLVVGLVVLIVGANGVAQDSDAESGQAADAVHALFESEWQRTMRENPVWASQLGDRRYNHLWNDVSEQSIERSAEATDAVLQRVRQVKLRDLSNADQLNLRLFIRDYEMRLVRHKLRLYLIPLDQRGGIQDESNLAKLLRFTEPRDYEDWIRRLNAFPAYMDQTIALMRQGMATGMMHPKVVMKRVPAQIRKQLVDDVEDSLYYEPFRSLSGLTDVQGQRLRASARQSIASRIIPSYQRFLQFFEDEYLPACYDEVGCWRRPDGAAMYAALAKNFTTTDLTPDQIHHIGQSEVARIRSEMQAIQRQVGFEGSFREFLNHLRTSPEFFYEDPDDLLQAYKDCCRRIDPELPRLFHRMPKIPYRVVPIPDQMAPDTTTAYYQPPASDGSRPGGYYVNLYRPQDRPKYEIEALSLHESVPGHHFQIALAMELENVPEFRRHARYTAYVEGWGLYSEKLGEEMGLYKDPYSKFGQLTYEMWRAIRLVVDTGIHHLRWSRREAIEFFAANTAKPMLDITNEVDRYIAWPGQALAYKIGELKIRELRARGEEKLGGDFDIKAFHDVVLRNGAVPLDILEAQVDQWIADR